MQFGVMIENGIQANSAIAKKTDENVRFYMECDDLISR
jgi:hypothetical protein